MTSELKGRCWRGECREKCYYPETCSETLAQPAAPQGGDVEALAEFLSWAGGDFTRWDADAHPDHNHWSWRGDGHGDAMREVFREEARAILASDWLAARDAEVARAVGERAWREGAITALDHATRNEDGITLSLDLEAHPNPYALSERGKVPQARRIAAVGDCGGEVGSAYLREISGRQIGAERFEGDA